MSCGSSECLFQTFHFNSWYLLKCLFQQYINGGRKMGIHRAAQHCDVVENQCVNMSLWFPVMRILDHVMWTFKIIGLKISWQCFNKRPVWTKYKYMLSLSPPLNHSALLYQQVAGHNHLPRPCPPWKSGHYIQYWFEKLWFLLNDHFYYLCKLLLQIF